MPALETVELRRRFGPHTALTGVTLTALPGSAWLLVGPNGAGKTTLLRLVATALRPTGGTARVFGRDVVRDAPAVRTLVAVAGAADGAYEALTPREHLTFAAAMSGRPVPPDLLAWAGLARVADRRVEELSQGLRRRLALARVRLLAPRLLLLDEPFTALDAEGQHLVEDLVRTVTERGGAVVLATHEWERGLRLADHVAVLVGGRLVAQGPRQGMTVERLRTLVAAGAAPPPVSAAAGGSGQ